MDCSGGQCVVIKRDISFFYVLNNALGYKERCLLYTSVPGELSFLLCVGAFEKVKSGFLLL